MGEPMLASVTPLNFRSSSSLSPPPDLRIQVWAWPCFRPRAGRWDARGSRKGAYCCGVRGPGELPCIARWLSFRGWNKGDCRTHGTWSWWGGGPSRGPVEGPALLGMWPLCWVWECEWEFRRGRRVGCRGWGCFQALWWCGAGKGPPGEWWGAGQDGRVSYVLELLTGNSLETHWWWQGMAATPPRWAVLMNAEAVVSGGILCLVFLLTDNAETSSQRLVSETKFPFSYTLGNLFTSSWNKSI